MGTREGERESLRRFIFEVVGSEEGREGDFGDPSLIDYVITGTSKTDEVT